MKAPQTYLALDQGEWTLMHQGAPIAPPKGTQTAVLAFARYARLPLLPIFFNAGHWHYLPLPRVYP